MARMLSELGLLRPERYLESTEGLILVALATSADLQRFSCIACLSFSGKLLTAFICCYIAIKLRIVANVYQLNSLNYTIGRQTNEPNFSRGNLSRNDRMQLHATVCDEHYD